MKKALPLVVVGLIAFAVLAIVASSKLQEKAKQYGLVPTAAPKVVVPSLQPSVDMGMKEGELPAGTKLVSSQVEYDSPGGLDTVNFRLQVDVSGKITGVQVEEVIANSESAKYQKSFANAIPSVIVGKKLTELTDLDVVGRASLTTDAFNQALPSLKQQLL